ncbi:MAG: NAD(P)H-dependent oxidoreductase [Epsilonproteobacteria bacterium]|nr:NAD(P)H-dependent oxidoreductase [Campylobacterota bacterium]NPA63998.1 NAD(P)H-dependent oxidoreductase [Campylobacterota bacterium]
MDRFLEAMEFRHACKIFDESKKISEEDFTAILEYGRLSPSSFGMEPWRFWVVTDEQKKRELRPLCWNQKQITTCSHLLLIIADNAAVQDDAYIEAMFQRRGLSPEATRAYIERYKSFLAKQNISCWTKKQCYIAAANMMTGAAYKRIDSCPIEGFDKEELEAYLGVDGIKKEVALIVAFGYRLNPQPPKRRLPLAQITTYL